MKRIMPTFSICQVRILQQVWLSYQGEGGVLPEKLGGGVRPTSQNPYPIYDQNLRFLLLYL